MAEPAISGDDPFRPVDVSPQEALDEYLEDQKAEKAEGTLKSHKSRLSFLVEFCEEKEIDSMLDLHPSHITKFRTWRSELNGMNKVTLKTNMDTLRVFLRWCARNRYVHPNLEDEVPSTEISRGDKIREVHLPEEHGDAIKQYLRQYHWGSEEHAAFELFWSAGLRLCSVHGLDVDDVNLDPPGKTPPHVELVHRPDSGTTLKNQGDSERPVGLPGPVAEAVKAWMNNPDRPDVTDDYGRRPLFTTKHGRRHRNGIREIVYGVTRPCTYFGECPIDDREVETCKAASDRTKAYECPESISPHAIRKGVATRQLKKKADAGNIAARMDCSEEVLWAWYSRLNKEEEMERRFAEFDEEYE